MRIAVLHPQAAFVRGGAEVHAESLVGALQRAGHEAELVQIAWQWYPTTELTHAMAVWRSFNISESNGLKIDAAIALKFPAYLATHERKIVWLIHQHRAAYDMWDHPLGDMRHQEGAERIREMIHDADRTALGEAKRIFTNSRNVRDRLHRTLGISGEVLYHPSPTTEALMEENPGPYGDYIFYPSRLEVMKRQSLVIEAMRHVKSPLTLVVVGRGPDEQRLRDMVSRLHLEARVRLEIGVTGERLRELFRGSLAVYNGPIDEDYGYVTLEGFAARRPVVTLSDSGGPLEFVTDGTTGRVVPPQPKAIAAAFDELHDDRAAVERMGEAGRLLIRSRVPSWDEIVGRLLDR
jgi:glycosyltransferase involved in cell wall biosynthesis